jgi:stage V sporulation protein B
MADATVTAGRGVVYIALAKFYFMVAGYVIYFILPRLLGSEILWGNYLLVIGLVSVIDNVIVTATIQAVSKFTAQDDSQADDVKRAALKVQVAIGGGLVVLYVASAPWIAAWEKDAGLARLYQLSAGIMLCYAFYAVFVGSLNGLRRFGGQATFDISFATLRGLLILGFTSVGWGIFGAVGGFVAAAAIILLAAIFWVGLPRRAHALPSGPSATAQRFTARDIWRFMVQLFVYNLALNLLMRMDLFLLKRFAAALSGEATVEARAAVASAYSGYYGTAQTLAFIPYQAILAVAFVVFPLVSRSTFENDRATTRAYVRQTLRLSLIFVVGVAVVFMANPEAVINVPYQAAYRVGGPALRVLSAGMVFFSMFTIINTILNGAGRTGRTILCGVVTLGVTVVANSLLVPRATSLESAMLVAACATCGSMVFGTVLSAVLLHREFGASFTPLSLVRLATAAAVALALGHFVPERSKLVTLGECVLVLGTYFLVLVVLREFGEEDLAKLKRILGRGSR